MSNESEIYTVLCVGLLLITSLAAFIVYFIILYQKKQQANQQQQEKLQANFRQELLKAQNEIQEQTLTHVSREIHDNVTQVLSFVKLNLALIEKDNSDEKTQKIAESRKLIAQAIADLRDLSKSMSFDLITRLGLGKTIEFETERINKSGLINVDFILKGDSLPLGDQRELVLFRIFQEALNNSLKHSAAEHLNVCLQFTEHLFTLTIEDDGAGFFYNEFSTEGSGLKNMQSRAALIGAVWKISSEPGKGCCIKITIDLPLQQIYADWTYQNSPG